ncbi:hypothetical protein CP532_0455 [Ophiocordyceps camponoti-leonardi (nom. inval.)]|nr:hypothetical protein CP532_0455 [Ophiocordyceps camponoti-leonardi (nom. inval.)]
MPILFGPRRQSTPAPPLTWETAAPDAANAAASAFRRREATLSLSNPAAAAAAALRARPMNSTNVSSVQPKRAVAHRRSPSVSSLIGRERLARRDIHRSPSVCSMAERSFRSPSPGGGQSPMPLASDAPPVPKLPSKVDVAPSVKSTKATDGAAPLQTQHFRTASQRVKDGRLGSWFGGAITRDGSNTRKRSSSVTVSGSGTIDGRSSAPNLNARPDSSVVRANSVMATTTPPKAVSDKPASEKPVREVSSRRLLPRRQLLSRSQSVRETPDKPKKAKQDLSRAGSHLSRGTTDRTRAPTLQSLRSPPAEQEPPVVSPVPQPTESTELNKKKKKKKKKPASKTKKADAPSETPVVVEEQTASADSQTTPAQDVKTAPGDSQISFGEPTPPLSDKPPVLELAFTFSGDDETPQPELKEPDEVTIDGAANGRAKSPPAAKRQGRARAAREPSESPARSARFASTTTQPLIMHEPPARSVSPMKSALKHLHPKDAAVADESVLSEDREQQSADRQEDTSVVAAAAPPKKSARVSWDDHTLVVGEPDSLDDKETEKPKLGDVREQQKSVVEDETMSPRPALPLFGSVRDKKCRDLEERPLVRPAERPRGGSHSTSETKSTAEDANRTSKAEAHEKASNNTANNSKYRVPLPAATSGAEGDALDVKDDEKDAQVSDDDLESDAETEKGLALDPSPADIALQRSSSLDGEDRRDDSLHTASAGSDADEEFVDSDDVASIEEDPARLTAARSGEAPMGPNSPLMEDIQEEEDETDRCSVYSDACEVLSPMESLDDGLHSSAGGAVSNGSSLGKQASPRSPNDWENAKSYWKSLTPDQRRQLEVEALEDDPDHVQSTAGSSKRSTSSTKETGSERSYQIKPGTRWEEQPPPVPPKPGMVRQSPTAAAPPKAAAAAAAAPPVQPPPTIPQPNSIELPRTAVKPRSEQPGGLGAPRTVRIGSFEAVWEPKYVEGAQYGPFARFIKGSHKSSSETMLPMNPRPTSQQPAAVSPAEQRPRNRSVDDTASQAITAERRGSDDSVSSFIRSRIMPLAVDNSPGIRSWMNDQQQPQPQQPQPRSQEQEQMVSSSPRSSSQPTHQGYGYGSAPTTTTTTAAASTAATTTAMSSPAVSSGGDGGYLRQSLRGETAPAPAPAPALAASSPALVSPGRRRSTSRRARKARKDSRLVDSSDEEDGGGSSHFRSRFDDSSDEDDDVPSGRRPRPLAKGMAKTMRGGANNSNRSSSAISPPTRPISDPGSPAPAWNREALPPPPSQNRFSSRPTTSRRRGSFMSMLFRKMREGGGSNSHHHHHYYDNNNNNNNGSPHSPLAERRSGSSGGSARQVLSAARQVLSSSDRGPRPSTASAPSRTRQLLVRRRTSNNNFEVGSDGGRQPRRKFAALRRMLGFYD